MRLSLRAFAALSAGAIVAAPAVAGPDWIEVGDAGSTIGTAQPVVGINNLTRISGTLSFGDLGRTTDRASTGVLPDFEDMYLIRIQVPSTFTFEVTGAAFNAQLFLFNITLPGEGFGLLANNDTPMSNAPLLSSPATDATGAQVLLPGVYAIGISGFGRVPVSISGPIFNFASPTEISGADGPGGLNPLFGWDGVGDVGSYEMEVEGIDFVDIPAPTSGLALLSFAGVFAGRRRR